MPNAKQEPHSGLKYRVKSHLYEVDYVDNEDQEVHVCMLDDNGNRIKNNRIPLVKWPPAGYEEVEDSDNKENKNQDSDSNRNKKSDKASSSFTFVYDAEKNELNILDANGKFVTHVDVVTANGKDGLSAYQEWVERQPKGTSEEDKSFPKFLEIFKGTDGKAACEWTINDEGFWCRDGVPTGCKAVGEKGDDGNSDFQEWLTRNPGGDWETYDRHRKGKDAFETWKSLDPTRKNCTEADFFRWIAAQVQQRIDAQDGAQWIPNVGDDGFLVFKNDRNGSVTDKYQVKGKDGKTYTPVFRGEKLVFIDEDGHEVTSERTFRGKSAFEVWQELPGNEGKREQDFFEFLKGEKGDPGQDGHNVQAKYGYKDIKDFKCPVQEINTDLIADTSEAAISPDKCIQDRMDEITLLREEGKKFKYGGFKEFFWWCSGADKPLLRMCPGDHSKYVGIGTVIFFTACMAFISSSYAISFVFKVDKFWDWDTLAVLGFGLFWGFMIFFLDRFITNTMYSDGEVTISKDEFIGGLPRILIAIFLGIVISAPLELKIFEQKIEMEMKNQKRAERNSKEQEARNAVTIAYEEKITELDHLYNIYQEQANEAKSEIKRIDSLPQPKQDRIQRSKKVMIGTDNNNNPIYENTHYEEVTNQGYIDKEYAKRLEDKNKASNRKDIAIHKRDSVLNLQKSTSSNKDDEIKKDVNEVLKDYDASFDDGLSRRLKTLHLIAKADFVPLFAPKDSTEKAAGAMVNEDKRGLINSDNENGTRIAIAIIAFVLLFLMQLGHAISRCRHENVGFWTRDNASLWLVSLPISLLAGGLMYFFVDTLYALLYFLFGTAVGLIMLLFILIDISPVLYKMMLADGVYDHYLQQEKLLKEDKIRLSLARMLHKIDQSDLQALSPFIIGKTYQKMYRYSISKSGQYGGEVKDYKEKIEWTSPNNELQEAVKQQNKEVFDKVLEYKRRIILACYAAWYRDMRDALIGSPDDPAGTRIKPESTLYEDMYGETKPNNDHNPNDGGNIPETSATDTEPAPETGAPSQQDADDINKPINGTNARSNNVWDDEDYESKK